jgi:hypothetical protein
MEQRGVIIKLGRSPSEASITIDGQDVTKHIFGLEISATPQNLVKVTLRAFVSQVEIAGDALVSLVDVEDTWVNVTLVGEPYEERVSLNTGQRQHRELEEIKWKAGPAPRLSDG